MLAQFPWKLLEKASLTAVSQFMRHEIAYQKMTAYCCNVGDIVELDNAYWMVGPNNAYNVTLENLVDGSIREVLPTIGVLFIGNLNSKTKGGVKWCIA